MLCWSGITRLGVRRRSKEDGDHPVWLIVRLIQCGSKQGLEPCSQVSGFGYRVCGCQWRAQIGEKIPIAAIPSCQKLTRAVLKVLAKFSDSLDLGAGQSENPLKKAAFCIDGVEGSTGGPTFAFGVWRSIADKSAPLSVWRYTSEHEP